MTSYSVMKQVTMPESIGVQCYEQHNVPLYISNSYIDNPVMPCEPSISPMRDHACFITENISAMIRGRIYQDEMIYQEIEFNFRGEAGTPDTGAIFAFDTHIIFDQNDIVSYGLCIKENGEMDYLSIKYNTNCVLMYRFDYTNGQLSMIEKVA